MNNEALVTVIIPAYNAESTLFTSLNSVITQQCDFSYLIFIIDDGSTDRTLELLIDYIKINNLNNITVFTKENGGVSSARNMGLRNVVTPFIAFLDADDEWLPGKLAHQMSVFMSNPEVYFLGTNRNSENYFFKKNSDEPLYEINLFRLLIKWWPSVPTVMLRKTVIDKVGYFDETVSHCEDCNYWLNVINSFPIHVVNKSYVITGGGKPNYGGRGLSANMALMHAGELFSLKLARDRAQIGLVWYLVFSSIFRLKYWRRIFIVFIRNKFALV